MSRQVSASVDNTFVKGLITEATGLNYPENAWIEGDNVIPSILGDVLRRPGMDFEDNFGIQGDISKVDRATSTYKWNNASGDGLTQIYVVQIGRNLTFYNASLATELVPLSFCRLSTGVDLTNYLAAESTSDVDLSECQYSDGNGYLFVFHPDCDPIYCTLTSNVITPVRINVQIRDFLGAVETNNIPVDFRPSFLSASHQYNLNNQGWTSAAIWGSTTASIVSATTGSHSFEVDAGMPVIPGQRVAISDPHAAALAGTVTAYAGTTITINVTSTNNSGAIMGLFGAYAMGARDVSHITDFQSAMGSYPSNADIWWLFKDTTGAFDPATTAADVSLSLGQAPKGHFIIDAFNQDRSSTSSVIGIAEIKTSKRPKAGAWYQGRAWYAGVDASKPPTGTAPYYTWTENIYFSQIITSNADFGNCYQNNDPTSEDFADLLPSDGGVIQIQGCGSVHKLFAIQNGLLVFASNGIWFITGSQGIGFTANDYTVTKISGVTSISGTSFVNVQGYPTFWNEDGIYSVAPNQQGSLDVNNLCLGTVLSFFQTIPVLSKKYVRGDYNPLDYIITWVYREENEGDLNSRYYYNRKLNINTATKSFYTDTMSNLEGVVYVSDVKFINGPGGNGASPSTFKYITWMDDLQFTFSEQRDTTTWRDFVSFNDVGDDYTSTFTTGYKIKPSQGMRRWQPMYVTVFTDNNTAYKIQGIWDYATSGSGGRYSQQQTFYNDDPYASVSHRRHKIRGHGMSLQLRYTSLNGEPFNIIGWSILETANATV